MDPVEIYSPESKDDIDLAWSDSSESPDRLSNLGAITDGSEMNYQNYTRSNCDEKASHSESFMGSRRRAEVPEVNPNIISRNNKRSERSCMSYEGASSAQQLYDEHPQKRSLPASCQLAIYKSASEGPLNYNDDLLIHKRAGKRRVLPPSLLNEKYVDSPLLGGSIDTGNHSGAGEQRVIVHDERAIYQEALQNFAQPKLEVDLPEGLLSVSLFEHQKMALAWMVHKESSRHCSGGILADDQGLGKTISMIALILKKKTVQSNFRSNDSQLAQHEALSLDDDDNDGSTVLCKEKQPGEDLEGKQVSSASVNTSGSRRPPAGTLIVCPATVLWQWARELKEKVTRRARLSVLVHHGGSRTKDPFKLAKYDVVLTTYSIVTNEVPQHSAAADKEQGNLDKTEISSIFSDTKKKESTSDSEKGKKKSKRNKDADFDSGSGALARVRWFRVILDEAQTIKNHRTQVSKACSSLRARNRWCLSGTPVQNSVDDLYSYFRFLKFEPYSSYSAFSKTLKSQISTFGYQKLQTVLETVMLRRKKSTRINGKPIVKLPPKAIQLKMVDFSPEERSFYKKLEADSRKQFKIYAAAGTVKQNYASIMLMLLRLRQACNHPILVKGYNSGSSERGSSSEARKLPKDMLLSLLHQLEGSLAICCVCHDPPEDAVVTICGHIFCYQCVSDRLTGEDNLCPAAGCKEALSLESAFSQATLRSCISEQPDNATSTSRCMQNEEPSIVESSYVSSKIKAALEILNSLCSPSHTSGLLESEGMDFCWDSVCGNSEIPVKAIVFSQWTRMLDLVEYSLNFSLIQYRRLDGSISLAARDEAVKEFNTDPEVTVMLMSLKAGNLGLNMVAASHVILLDLWWNPAAEDQAIDRTHRIGQTRPVIVSRLTIKDTVEDRILALQEEKRKLVADIIGEYQSGIRARKLTMDDLKYLFEVFDD